MQTPEVQKLVEAFLSTAPGARKIALDFVIAYAKKYPAKKEQRLRLVDARPKR